MQVMTEHRVRHLPVVEAEEVVGVISIGDLVNYIMNAQRAAIEQLQSYIAGEIWVSQSVRSGEGGGGMLARFTGRSPTPPSSVVQKLQVPEKPSSVRRSVECDRDSWTLVPSWGFEPVPGTSAYPAAGKGGPGAPGAGEDVIGDGRQGDPAARSWPPRRVPRWRLDQRQTHRPRPAPRLSGAPERTRRLDATSAQATKASGRSAFDAPPSSRRRSQS
jgi:hypothetical protein